MKALKLSLCFFLIFLFSACSNGEFRSLVSFISSYNESSSEKISLASFVISADDTYTVFPYGNILLSLREGDSEKIESCKIIIAKPDGTLPKSEDIEHFREVLTNTLIAYCSYDREAAEKLINSFGLSNNDTFTKEGELTLESENFYFVYYSDKVTNQLTVSNTYLEKIEETSKPVSKPYYGENFIEKD